MNKQIVGKKGYMKTLEAVLAIVIILIFTFAITPKPEQSYDAPYALTTAQGFIMSQVQGNATIRALVINSDLNPDAFTLASNAIDGQIKENLPPGFGYSFGICDVTSCISNTTAIALETSIYTTDVFIATSDSGINPKIVRMWAWREQ